jgi:class 3 adenylate cyclase
MRPTTHKALLVIADISGFTQFMKSHENVANHALHVIVELLRAIISVAAAPLKLAEVEGDAVFFYARCKENGDSTAELAAIKKQVMSFFRSFYQTLNRLCALYPCARNAQDLRLKVVIHAGEVALEHIHGFDKLFGMDVILTHRLLKNSVPSQEYVLMTEAAYNWLGDFQQLEPQRQTEYCDGIGVVETLVIYLPAQFIHVGKKPHEKSHPNTGYFLLPSVDLFNTARDRRGTALNDHLLSESPQRSARAQPVEAVRLTQFQTDIKWRPKHEIYVTDLL